MSRGQETSVYNTANKNSGQDQSNGQSSYGATQDDINNYRQQLSDFMSSNPYKSGGEYDKTINTGLAATSQAGANSLAGNLQSQSLRTGQNSAADAATAAEYARQNQRQLSADQANAEQQRIGSEASYNQAGLQAAQEPISAESGLYSSSTGAANQSLNTAEGAAQTPSFWDQVGSGFSNALAGGGSAAGGQIAKHYFG